MLYAGMTYEKNKFWTNVLLSLKSRYFPLLKKTKIDVLK
jgi:hypothetical protein